ncbi:ras gtpase-activating protein [Anaeramoeba flamelloides]|uniref:Ras gtpase-activating protein n=1 Tax=Anaeramoeba flamelloides TaxID=1746091 RepID=A0AAV7Z367_9EUKA|nr:ras gtpase-activating protein [Anaeramoeba flamelloides]
MTSLEREFSQCLEKISKYSSKTVDDDPIPHLLSWVNQKLEQSKQKKKIILRSFSSMNDCKNLCILFDVLYPNNEFDLAAKKRSKSKRVQNFIQLTEKILPEIQIPDKKELMSKDSKVFIVLITKLFLKEKEESYKKTRRNTPIPQKVKKTNLSDSKSKLKSGKPRQNSNFQQITQVSSSEEQEKEKENEKPETKEHDFNVTSKKKRKKKKQKPKRKKQLVSFDRAFTANYDFDLPKENETKNNSNEESKSNTNNSTNSVSSEEPEMIDIDDFPPIPNEMDFDIDLINNQSSTEEPVVEKKKSEEHQLLSKYATVGKDLLSQLVSNHQNVLTSIKNIGQILPDLIPIYADLQKQLVLMGSLEPMKEFNEISSQLILTQTFWRILKSFKLTNVDHEFQTELKKIVYSAETGNELTTSKFLEKVVNKCKETKIITEESSEASSSIYALINQYFYSTVMKMRLAHDITSRLCKYKILSISINSDEFEKIRNKIYLAFDRYMPGFVDFNESKQAVITLFQMLNLSKQIKNKDITKLLNEAREEAIGRTLYFIINRYYGQKFGDMIINFFEDKQQGIARKRLYHSLILPMCRDALSKYMSTEDADNLVFSIQSAICKKNGNQYSQELIAFLDSVGLVLPFAEVAITHEVLKNPSAGTLFRSNDVNSKVISKYSKLIGDNYLIKTLGPVFTEMLDKNITCEIDPKIVTNEEEREENLKNFKHYFCLIMETIFDSVPNIPPELRMLCSYYKRITNLKFPNQVLSTVGGFVFLRFLCPAMVTPVKHGLYKGTINKNQRRSLMLLSSATQALSNGVMFSQSRGYMMPINEVIEKYFDKRNEFLTKISSSRGFSKKLLYVPISLKYDFPNPKILSTSVRKHFTSPKGKKISPLGFASNLLADVEKYLTLDLTQLGLPYFSLIFEKMKNITSIIDNLTKSLNPVEFLIDRILDSEETMSFIMGNKKQTNTFKRKSRKLLMKVKGKKDD